MMQEQYEVDKSVEVWQEMSPELITLEESCHEINNCVETSLTHRENKVTNILLAKNNDTCSSKNKSSQSTIKFSKDNCHTNAKTATEETNEYVNDSERAECSTSKDKRLITQTAHELLECPVCLNNMVPPIVLCEFGHNICFKCRPLMTQCPLCKGSFLNTRNIALEILARFMGFSCDHEGCFGRCGTMKNEVPPLLLKEQKMYTCPLTLYSNCYWQGRYSEIRGHYENMHSSKILVKRAGLTASWEINLLVREYKLIFALDEIFFYKEKLDTSLSFFFIQVFYIGDKENISQFSYKMTISSGSGHQTYTCTNSVLPIEDLEHNYTYTERHCSMVPYTIVNDISKHGDLKFTLSLKRLVNE